MGFKAGFVNIIGKPNVGKSTLMNVMVGEKLSIITPKAQTTRKRILGIVSTDDCQIVFSDTPGIIDSPQYKLHNWMNDQVTTALTDSDILILMTDPYDKLDEQHHIITQVKTLTTPIIIVVNKIDTLNKIKLDAYIEKWKTILPEKEIITISALEKTNTDTLYQRIVELLPEHPAYFDKDEITDQSERFIVAEIIREKIFLNYQEEIPYNVEVNVEEYKDKGNIIAIRAVIYVGRDTHKSIIIGKGGAAIKQTGIDARLDIEGFTGNKVFLELFVKVKENWKNEDRTLKYFGYN